MRVILFGAVFALAYTLHGSFVFGQETTSGPGASSKSSVVGASYTVASRELNVPHYASAERQIKVDVRFVVVDSKTRADFYKELGHKQIKTAFTDVPEVKMLVGLPVSSSDLQSYDKTFVPSHVSTCILDQQKLEQVMSQVDTAAYSNITYAPSIILIDGQEAELNDLAQRPFVVSSNYVAGAETVEPSVKVFEQGSTIHIKASIDPSGNIQLASRIISQEIVDVSAATVFGIGPVETKVQVPVQHLRAVTASEVIEPGAALLIDPYVTQHSVLESESKVPVLSKLPYVGTRFKNTSRADLRQHVIFLLTPSIHKTVEISQK